MFLPKKTVGDKAHARCYQISITNLILPQPAILLHWGRSIGCLALYRHSTKCGSIPMWWWSKSPHTWRWICRYVNQLNQYHYKTKIRVPTSVQCKSVFSQQKYHRPMQEMMPKIRYNWLQWLMNYRFNFDRIYI